MDGNLPLHPLVRILVLNTEIHEMRTELMRQPLASTRIAELQESMDRCHRASLITCWLTEGYELEDEGEEDDEGCSTSS